MKFLQNVEDMNSVSSLLSGAPVGTREHEGSSYTENTDSDSQAVNVKESETVSFR